MPGLRRGTASALLALCGQGAAVDVYCNASSADARGVNAAISASADGACVTFHGLCLLNETVELLGGRTYQGTSRSGTVLRQANGTNLHALVASDTWLRNQPWTGAPVRLAHMTLDANRAANLDTSALVLRSWLTTIEDLFVVNAPVDGIQLANAAADGHTMLGTSQVNGVIQNVMVQNSGRHGVHVQDAGNAITDWSLLNSWVASSGASGIYLENGAGWQVKNNHIYDVGDHGVYLHFCFGSTISDNYVEDFGGNGRNGTVTGQDSFYGTVCVMQDGAASVISGNKVHQLRAGVRQGRPYNYVAAVFDRNANFAEVSVYGNTVRGDNGTDDVGLAYLTGTPGTDLSSTIDLRVMSAANHVQVGQGKPRRVDAGVTLVQPL